MLTTWFQGFLQFKASKGATITRSFAVQAIRGLCVASVLSLGLVATAGAAKPPQTTDDGLELTKARTLTKAKGIELLYLVPGISLVNYTKLMIDPAQGAFSDSWDPRDYSTFGLKAADGDRIRSELRTLPHDTLIKVLARLAESGLSWILHESAARNAVIPCPPLVYNSEASPFPQEL